MQIYFFMLSSRPTAPGSGLELFADPGMLRNRDDKLAIIIISSTLKIRFQRLILFSLPVCSATGMTITITYCLTVAVNR